MIEECYSLKEVVYLNALEKSVFVADNGEFKLNNEHLTNLAPHEGYARKIIYELAELGHLQAIGSTSLLSPLELKKLLKHKESPIFLKIHDFKRARFSILLIFKKFELNSSLDMLNELLQVRDELLVSECFAYIKYTFKQKKIPYDELEVEEIESLILKGVSNFSLSQLYSYIWYISVVVMEQPGHKIDTKSKFKNKYIELFRASSYRITNSQNHLDLYKRPKTLKRSCIATTIDDELLGLFNAGFHTKSIEAIESLIEK